MQDSKTRKSFRFSDKILKIIEDVKIQNGFLTETDALIHIIISYEQNDRLLKDIKDSIKNDLTRFRFGVRTAEQNSIIIKDVLNTMLFSIDDIDMYMPAHGLTKHDVIKLSEEKYAKMIAEKNIKKHSKGDKK